MFKEAEHGLVVSRKGFVVIDFRKIVQIDELCVNQSHLFRVVGDCDTVCFEKLRSFVVDKLHAKTFKSGLIKIGHSIHLLQAKNAGFRLLNFLYDSRSPKVKVKHRFCRVREFFKVCESVGENIVTHDMENVFRMFLSELRCFR